MERDGSGFDCPCTCLICISSLKLLSTCPKNLKTLAHCLLRERAQLKGVFA